MNGGPGAPDGNVVVSELVDAGLDATLEYPGYVAIAHEPGVSRWEWGTANGTWGGELVDDDGRLLDTRVTDLPGTCRDPHAIALAIIGSMLPGGCAPFADLPESPKRDAALDRWKKGATR